MDPVVSVLDLEIRKILRQNFKERERERETESIEMLRELRELKELGQREFRVLS